MDKNINIVSDINFQETEGKVQPLQLTFRNPPEKYFFMTWNWPVIRKVSLWMFLSCLVAMVALVVTMITQLPKSCNPHTEWYQGSVMYEVFPASFYDSDNDMFGDFKGMFQKSNYFTSLNISAVRLNSIFKTPHYPEDYKKITSLTEIAPQLGDLRDFQILVKHLKSKNISVILDLPIYPLVKELVFSNNLQDVHENFTNNDPSIEFLRKDPTDIIEEALKHWINQGVNGFYLKGLENLVEDPHFPQSLRRWKKILGPDRPLIVNELVVTKTTSSKYLNVVLNNIDLVEIRLEIEEGEQTVSKQIENIQNGTLFSKPGTPWILWSLGDENTVRLANVLPYGNATLGATLLQLMLPGTPSIFYGNEIGLRQILDPQGEREDLVHLHQLAPMPWRNQTKEMLYWIHGEKTVTSFDQVDLIAKMIALRADSPSIYVNSVYKQGDNKANAEVKYSRSDLMVIQRWYPRRKSFVVVSNLGSAQITADISTLLYSGHVVVGPRADSIPDSVSFKNISLWPGESVVILLD